MTALPLLLALFTASPWCKQNYSVTYALAELKSQDGMHQVLERIERVAEHYCAQHPLVRSHQGQRLCTDEAVTKFANNVDHAPFRDFVKQSQIDQRLHNSPILM